MLVGREQNTCREHALNLGENLLAVVIHEITDHLVRSDDVDACIRLPPKARASLWISSTRPAIDDFVEVATLGQITARNPSSSPMWPVSRFDSFEDDMRVSSPIRFSPHSSGANTPEPPTDPASSVTFSPYHPIILCLIAEACQGSVDKPRPHPIFDDKRTQSERWSPSPGVREPR